MWTKLIQLGSVVLGKILPARKASPDNTAESTDKPVRKTAKEQSFLALCRSVFIWTLLFLLIWEVAGRLVIVPLFFPNAVMPESALSHVITLLMQLLGF